MQSDQAGTDDLKKEKGKNKGKIANKLHTDVDSIKNNQNNDFKKIRISDKRKTSAINNQASDEQVVLSLYQTVLTDCEVCVIIVLCYYKSFSADSCRVKWERRKLAEQDSLFWMLEVLKDLSAIPSPGLLTGVLGDEEDC